jgi:hypothetical protein
VAPPETPTAHGAIKTLPDRATPNTTGTSPDVATTWPSHNPPPVRALVWETREQADAAAPVAAT